MNLRQSGKIETGLPLLSVVTPNSTYIVTYDPVHFLCQISTIYLDSPFRHPEKFFYV
jgi:hypothetical protein